MLHSTKRRRRFSRSFVGTLVVAVGAALCGSARAAAQGADELGIQVPEGFTARLFADDDLAHDIFSMTIDSRGRVVVAAPGYVRILVDTDGDGRADEAKQFADGPVNGAQGLYFHGDDLLCVGDAGLLRFRDRDRDDRADGPPEVFLKLRTGQEHTAHAVRRGPDGWWYLIVGNEGRITSAYASLPTSPIRAPQAGALVRFAPDLSAGEIVADGYRNAYDFDFHALGDVFVFDSDDERDVSLPWYRPTRVFQALPGSNAGWVSKGWKHPDYFVDMPPVAASCGRGSPTGVVCYRHRQFPAPYRGAVFVLDWTFGRVLALPLKGDGSAWSAPPREFITSVGRFGFAPTDAAVGPDGSLFVSVGGRGTRGGVYRVQYTGNKPANEASSQAEPQTEAEKLAACLEAPQPLSSWSRARWTPLAQSLGREAFVHAARNEELSAESRLRAIEILTELFDGLDDELLRVLATTRPAAVRARAIWSHGRGHALKPSGAIVAAYLDDDDPLVQRCALEALCGASAETDWPALMPALAARLQSSDRFVRQLAGRIAARMPEAARRELSARLGPSFGHARVMAHLGRVERSGEVDMEAVEAGVDAFETDHPAQRRLDALRLVQVALGDLGPREKIAPAFDGYHSRLDLAKEERRLDPVRIRLAKAFPTGDHQLDHELLRTLAVLSPYNAGLLERILEGVTEQSDPVDDIHRLIVCARIPVDYTNQQQEKIAAALVSLEPKIVGRKLHQDQHWDERIGELYSRLVSLGPALPQALVQQQGFGRPGHVLFMSEFGAEQVEPAIGAFVRMIGSDPEYRWTNNVVFAIGESSDPGHRRLIREQYDRFSVRSAVVMTLAEQPDVADRTKFVEGLASSQLEVLGACLDAFEKLPAATNPAELAALVTTLRRLGSNKPEYQLRERVARALERSTGETHGFEFGEAGYRPQPEVIERWTAWIKKKYPQEGARQEAAAQAELEQVATLLSGVDWDHGDGERGRKLFETRACGQCHGGGQALGPDLAGVAGRFSREDLFTAIVLPDRDVSPRYQTTMIQTHDGKTYTGRIIYEAADGIILRNASNQTFRIEPSQIEDRRALNTSLMPAGLLKGLQPADVADLYAYLRSLGADTSQVTAAGADLP